MTEEHGLSAEWNQVPCMIYTVYFVGSTPQTQKQRDRDRERQVRESRGCCVPVCMTWEKQFYSF